MSKRRVLWVTNLAAPYRLPVWEKLGHDWDLTVALLESSRRLTEDTQQNRGSDWTIGRANRSYVMRELDTYSLRRGEERHYVLRGLSAFAAVRQSDVILLGGWDSPAYLQLLSWAKLRRQPVVGFYESTQASHQQSGATVIGRLRSRFFKSLDAVVVPGQAARDAVLDMGVPAQRVLTGFNAIDTDRFRAARFVASDNGGHRFLYVGQLIERKNVQAIVRAFDDVAGPRDSLTLIGVGPERDALKEYARTLSSAARIEFVDYIPNEELPAWMGRHDTLVLASRREVWGLVVNEALAAGMRCVVTEGCGVVPSVRHMPGVFVSEADASDLADKMRDARLWPGARVMDPPILQHTPEQFAEVFSQALAQALATRKGGWK